MLSVDENTNAMGHTHKLNDANTFAVKVSISIPYAVENSEVS
jgi:hypothetical protein